MGPRAAFAEEDEDAFDARHSRPARRRPLPWLRMALVSSLSIAGLVLLAQRRDRDEPSPAPKPIPPAVLIAPAPVWKPLPAATPVFALERSPAPLALEARQHAHGGREDILAAGAFGAPVNARIAVAQGATEPPRSFFVDLVRRAAEVGLAVARHARSRTVPTKFGALEAASVELAGAAEQACQAFRFADPEAGFGFQGWLCADAPVSDLQVACLVDGIALAGGAGPAVRALFARAERSRSETCGPASLRAAAGAPTPPQRP